jgi:hypothetical protein
VDLGSKPPYWRDPRLEKELRFYPNLGPPPVLAQPHAEPNLREHGVYHVVRLVQGRVTEPQKLLQKIKTETGVSLLLQGDWMRNLLTVPLQAGPAREFMDALATTFSGKWFQLGDTWVLAHSLEEARLTLIPEQERATLGNKPSPRCSARLRGRNGARWRRQGVSRPMRCLPSSEPGC